MNNLNSTLIEGNLVRDPVCKTTQKGSFVCNFSIASNRWFQRNTGLEKEVCFFDVETLGKLAENCNRIGKQGRGVRVVGRLRQDRWNGEDGKPRSRVIIVAEHVEFKPNMDGNANDGNGEYTEEEYTDPAVTSDFPPDDEVCDEQGIEPVTSEEVLT